MEIWKKIGLMLMIAWMGNHAVAEPVRLKDLGRFEAWRDNALVGYGLVTGLAGSGDSSANKATRQSLANALGQMGLSFPSEQMLSRNAALVMVQASLPAFARPGDTVDVLVTSAGDARSLAGGALLLTSLKAANGKVYALAQGAVSVGGYKYDANGNVAQKNHPTVGTIARGATVELATNTRLMEADGRVAFKLTDADITTARRISDAINQVFGQSLAIARTAGTVDIQVPESGRDDPLGFLAKVEHVLVVPDALARVVVNERTGTVVAGADVRIEKVAIAHGDLNISVETAHQVSQPVWVAGTGVDVRSVPYANSRLSISESGAAAWVAPGHVTVAQLVEALVKIKVSTRDIISILQAVKGAGALHAELVIQ